jgi:hypothetical protein
MDRSAVSVRSDPSESSWGYNESCGRRVVHNMFRTEVFFLHFEMIYLFDVPSRTFHVRHSFALHPLTLLEISYA